MTISGFTFVRNATKLYYPVRESIESVLPIVDEFIVALGDCDPSDRTREVIEGIGSDKIKIIDTKWDIARYPGGTEFAHQTDIAKEVCKGDWLFYIQSDEVIHERSLSVIYARCQELLDDERIEGLLFRYLHFWGDFDHHIISHVWYPKEIRIIRNDSDIHSWRDAQSFRKMNNFDGSDYWTKKNTQKLRVATVDATVYHYGWVRPPDLMQDKRRAFSLAKRSEEATEKMMQKGEALFNYGDLSKLSLFKGTHPAVMKKWIERLDWQDHLYPHRMPDPGLVHKHERLKYRVLTFIEQNLLNGKRLGGFKNYHLVRP